MELVYSPVWDENVDLVYIIMTIQTSGLLSGHHLALWNWNAVCSTSGLLPGITSFPFQHEIGVCLLFRSQDSSELPGKPVTRGVRPNVALVCVSSAWFLKSLSLLKLKWENQSTINHGAINGRPADYWLLRNRLSIPGRNAIREIRNSNVLWVVI